MVMTAHMQTTIQPPVAAAVESVTDRVARGSDEWVDASLGDESCFGANPAGVRLGGVDHRDENGADAGRV